MYRLSEEHAIVRDLSEAIAQAGIKDLAEKTDEEAVFPLQNLRSISDAGLFACEIPDEYGGAGLDTLSQVLVIEAVGKACGSTAEILASTAAAVDVINRYGSEELKKKAFSLISSCRTAALAFDEGIADSSANVIKTECSGNILNGKKSRVFSVGYNAVYIISSSDGEKKHLNAVFSGNGGLTEIPYELQMGFRGCSLGEIELKDCRTDEIICTDDFIEYARNANRIYHAAASIGMAQGALNAAIEYANERIQFKRRISEFQNTQHRIARLQSRIDAAIQLLRTAASKKDNGIDCTRNAASAKYLCDDIANLSTYESVQIMGGFGYTREYPVERMMRNARMAELYGGTCEEQLDLIGGMIAVK